MILLFAFGDELGLKNVSAELPEIGCLSVCDKMMMILDDLCKGGLRV